MTKGQVGNDGISIDKDGFFTFEEEVSDDVSVGLSGDPDDVEIEIVDDRPEEDRVAPRDTSRSSDTDDFEDESKDEEADQVLQANRIRRLRYEFHEKRREAEAAERQRDEAIRLAEFMRAENERLQRVLKDGEKVLVDEVRARTKVDVEQARAALRRAVEEGDPDKVAAAQEALSRAVYDLRQAETYRIREQEAPQNRPVQQPVQQAGNDPKLESWLSRNPWFQKDQRMTEHALSIHRRLIEKDGIFPVGDEYYRRIDAEMRNAFPSHFRDKSSEEGEASKNGKAEPARKKPASAVAPAVRTASTKPKKLVLTASQAQVARRMGLTYEQYAKEYAKLMEAEQNG